MVVKAKDLLSHLEQACRDRGIRLLYDDLQTEGGHCRAHDTWFVIINRRASAETRVKLLSEALERIPKQLPEEFAVVSATALVAQMQSGSGELPDRWQ